MPLPPLFDWFRRPFWTHRVMQSLVPDSACSENLSYALNFGPCPPTAVDLPTKNASFDPFDPTHFLIVTKMSLPKRSAPYWSYPPFLFFFTFGHSGAQSSKSHILLYIFDLTPTVTPTRTITLILILAKLRKMSIIPSQTHRHRRCPPAL